MENGHDGARVTAPTSIVVAGIPDLAQASNPFADFDVDNEDEQAYGTDYVAQGNQYVQRLRAPADHDDRSSISAEPLPPYEQLHGRPAPEDPRMATYGSRMSAPNMLGAMPVRIKAKWLTNRKAGPLGVKLRFEELMFIGPHMTIEEFQWSFAHKAAGQQHHRSTKPVMKADEGLHMKVKATWRVHHILRDKKRWVYATLQNWPEIVGGLGFHRFEGLKVTYWIDKLKQANDQGPDGQ